jgi:pentatricopeptide repeat protein
MVKRQLASLYHEDGDYENAIKYYRSNSSGSSTTAMNLCSIYESEGRLEEAIEVMEKRLEVDPKDIYAYARLIKLHVKAGNIDKAKELIEEFSKKQSELDLRTYARLTFYYKALAECYEMLGDLDKALDHLKRLENAIRKHIQEYNRRSRYLHSLNEWLEVVKKIDELSRKVTSNNDNSERFD